MIAGAGDVGHAQGQQDHGEIVLELIGPFGEYPREHLVDRPLGRLGEQRGRIDPWKQIVEADLAGG